MIEKTEEKYFYIEGTPCRKFRYGIDCNGIYTGNSKVEALRLVRQEKETYRDPSAKIFHCNEVIIKEVQEVV
jgi:hypothetical protein